MVSYCSNTSNTPAIPGKEQSQTFTQSTHCCICPQCMCAHTISVTIRHSCQSEAECIPLVSCGPLPAINSLMIYIERERERERDLGGVFHRYDDPGIGGGDKIHGSAHSLHHLPRNHPIGQVPILGNLLRRLLEITRIS